MRIRPSSPGSSLVAERVRAARPRLHRLLGTCLSVAVCAAVGLLVGWSVGAAPGSLAQPVEQVPVEQSPVVRAPAEQASGNPSGLPWRSGVFSHDVQRTEGFEAARGRPVDVLAVFPTRDSWEALMNPWWMGPSAVPEGFSGTLNVGLPLFPGDGSLEAAAAGEYDSRWRQMGALIASRYPDAYVRPGWEFNIPNWPWAATPQNATEWTEAYRRAAVNLRAGGPGLRIVWNPNEGQGASLPDASMVWPGEQYVDVVGLDAYDWYPAYSGGGWDEHRTKNQGWDHWAAFARERGKRFALPEWGVMSGSPASGGDNPHYITAVLGWLEHNSDIVEFETYFEETEEYCRCALSQNPAAQQAYIQALERLGQRTGGPSPPTPQAPAPQGGGEVTPPDSSIRQCP